MSRRSALDDFIVGAKIIIVKQPSFWSSSLNRNCPIDHGVVYPYHCIIRELKKESDHIAMTDGKYGWDLSTLIDEDIINNIAKLRKEKLKKLNGKR